jgi:RNA polymerase sigma-70 factor (ECF subfamily)
MTTAAAAHPAFAASRHAPTAQPWASAAGVCPRELVSHRAYLVRFAQRKLRDPMQAEDVVHDVFEAVLTGRARFAGRSALRSWLTGILKHKIVDLVRRDAGTDSYDDSFDDDGPAARPSLEPQPDEVAEQRQSLALTLARIGALPPGLRDVMELRVLTDLPTQEVCGRLAISEANLFVRLHRARRQLLS